MQRSIAMANKVMQGHIHGLGHTGFWAESWEGQQLGLWGQRCLQGWQEAEV